MEEYKAKLDYYIAMQNQANDFSNSKYNLASPNYEFAMKPMPKIEINNSKFDQLRNNLRNDIKYGNNAEYLKENLIPKEQLQYEIPKTENQTNKTTASQTKQKDNNMETKQVTNWIMPVDGKISSPYGKRKPPTPGASAFHNGIDIDVPIGTPVKAIADGKVIEVGPAGGYGKWVVLDHGQINGVNVTSEYGHISEINVEKGQIIKQGDVIAKSGNEGISTKPHLHLTIRENKVNYNNRGTGVPISKYLKY